jgi:hypothetical protein
MPRYFFHLRDRSGTLLDIEGSEHADAEAAAAEAMRHARGMIVEDVRHRGEVPLGDRIEITDAAGTMIATVSFADSLAIIWGAAKRESNK